ncbi:hypothetical protein AH06_184 [Erwinia phage AH06]|nr:hypothetical protein AH06_184 [Erwinia phage AH06]
MKINIDANVIKSPVNSEFLIADRIQFETDNLVIMLNALDINVPINNPSVGFGAFNFEGREKQGNWMSYWVNVRAKDLIELYPQVHAHTPGHIRSQTPYDFQFTIGHGVDRSPYDRRYVQPGVSDPEKRYVEVLGVEAGSEELAVRQILSIVAGQLLTSHPQNARVVDMVNVHVAEQLIQAGMTHFKSGDIKLAGVLMAHDGPIQTERLWRLGNPGEGKLTLKHTLLTRQTGSHSRITNLIPAEQHEIQRIDGKYEHNTTSGGMAMNMQPDRAMMQMHQQQQMYPQTQMPGMQPGGYPHMQPQNRMLLATTPLQLANLIALAYREGLDKADAEAFAQWGIAQLQAGDELPGYTAIAQWKQSLKAQGSDAVPNYCNRSLSDRDMGGRDTTTPILGKIEQIEIEAILIGEDSVEVVSEDRCNAYGVYRRERQGKSAIAVSVGDFLKSGEATDYAVSLAEKYDVAVKSMRAVTQ